VPLALGVGGTAHSQIPTHLNFEFLFCDIGFDSEILNGSSRILHITLTGYSITTLKMPKDNSEL